MRSFLSELQSIDEVYRHLRDELSRHLPETADDSGFAAAILRKEELLSQVGQLTDRVNRLSEEWVDFRERVDPAVRASVETLTRRVRADAEDLLRVCSGSSQRLQAGLERLGRDVRHLQKGFRYLDTVKPIRTNNYPKFIDSLG